MYKVFSLILLATAILFAILYFQERSALSGETSRYLAVDSAFSKLKNQPRLKEVLNAFNTAPIDYNHAKDLAAYFHHNFDIGYEQLPFNGKIPYGVWVDKRVISGTLMDASVDGFRIIPIQYMQPETQGSQTYPKNAVSFAIVFTAPNTTGTGDPHQESPSQAFDFNQPCPHPPCQ